MRVVPFAIRDLAAALIGLTLALLASCASRPAAPFDADEPYLVVLGIAQDGGVPQAGAYAEPGWKDPAFRRHVVCLGLVDPASGERWMFEATPDFREQLTMFHEAAGPAPATAPRPLSGIFLTHAHIGHYTGLMFLGLESMGARGQPVYATPRMRQFLETSGPWSQLVSKGNIELRTLEAGTPVALNERLRVTPFLVPHRQEFSEVVGFKIEGPRRKALFIPDIDSWTQLDATGVRIEDLIAEVDIAYLDGTFYANGELPGRDMSGFPHPFIAASMERFAPLPATERAKIHFIHLNHTNPALWPGTDSRRAAEHAGFAVASEGERFGL